MVWSGKGRYVGTYIALQSSLVRITSSISKWCLIITCLPLYVSHNRVYRHLQMYYLNHIYTTNTFLICDKSKNFFWNFFWKFWMRLNNFLTSLFNVHVGCNNSKRCGQWLSGLFVIFCLLHCYRRVHSGRLLKSRGW